jgi:GNAT superfamily N-acetyltransferase
MQVTVEPTTQLDSYELEAATMAPDDIPRLHELSVAVAWPHRAEDWAMLIQLGEGIIARDAIGRLAGSAMWFHFGTQFASIGMVIVSPRLQQHGAGHWLMAHVLDRLDGRGKVLNATSAAYRLYASLGFQPLGSVFQHSGPVRRVPAILGDARPTEPRDGAAIHALDTAALGAARPRIIDTLLAASTGMKLVRNGRLIGFALCRPFGRGVVIGPVVAETEDDALALVTPIIAAHRGIFLRMDTREPDGKLRQMLTAAGLRLQDTVTRMRLGRPLQPRGKARTFGLASHTLG